MKLVRWRVLPSDCYAHGSSEQAQYIMKLNSIANGQSKPSDGEDPDLDIMVSDECESCLPLVVVEQVPHLFFRLQIPW